MIDNVNVEDNSTISTQFTTSIQGNNDGKRIENNYDWPETLKGSLYARLVMSYTTKDGEERLDSLGIQEVGSFTWVFVLLIIVGVLIVVAVDGAIVYYFLFWRKKQDSCVTEKTNSYDDKEISMTDKNEA